MTRSEDGGLDDVLEFFWARAKRSCNSATVVRRESICACWALIWARKRLQLAQLDFFVIVWDYMHARYGRLRA